MSDDGTKDIKRWNPEPGRPGPAAPAARYKVHRRGEVVRPGQYTNGENREGTPAGSENTSARQQHYKHPEQEAHRRNLGSQPYPGKR